MAREYHKGKYTLRNPEKYIGDPKNVIYRSSWEKILMIRFDNDPNVIQWGSEEFHIPYVSPVDKEVHRYFPDFVVKSRTKDGKVKKVVFEVKPFEQTMLPKPPKRITKQYKDAVRTFAVNDAKWKSARQWCAKHDMEFHLLTENEIGIK